MLFYDFEVTKYDWMVVIIDTDTRQYHKIVNNRDNLKDLYEKNIDNIWIGYNNVHYDQYIFKSILLGMNPKSVNDKIIKLGIPAWRISNEFSKIPMINYDVFLSLTHGLKTLEAFMGNDIQESEMFDIQRPLTDDEIDEMLNYCTHDVEQTMEVFVQCIDDFNAVMGLIKSFPEVLSINDLSRTKAQISAKILECHKVDRDDEFNLSILPCINLGKYDVLRDWFLNPDNHWYKSGNKKNEFKLMVAGIEHTFGFGGVHGAKEKYYLNDKSRAIYHVDVASFYPRLMIFWNLLTRNCKKPEKFKQIYEKRIALKRAGKKKEQAPLKIVINGTYGICKDATSQAFDPLMANMICVNGQLMLIDLIDKLESIEGIELIQSNTDGLILSIPNDDESFNQLDDICYDWEQRCRMELEFDEIDYIVQKDVNNYLFKFSNGKIERKGKYVKPLSNIDFDLPIVNQAIVDYLTSGVRIEKTINDCEDLRLFQKVVKLSNKYDYVLHNGNRYNNKAFRVFASNNPADGRICKCRTGDNPAKFADTPDKCFIDNGDVKNKVVPVKLDRWWYINLAVKRLRDFGVTYDDY